MKFWKDPKTGVNMASSDCADEWLWEIWAIGVDYDACNDVPSLKKLIDKLVQYSLNARECLYEGKIFPENQND